MGKVAVLIDGGFYRRRSLTLWGRETAEQAAKSLVEYAMRHVRRSKSDLYRIFYYDCPPADFPVFHPLLKKNISLRKEDVFTWQTAFLEELRNKRKVALRLGELSERQARYVIRERSLRDFCSGTRASTELTMDDLELSIPQKGVDMKIAVDIASMAFKQQVEQMVLIAGDSDFVPAAKLARREGIDFILDPMWAHIRPSLNEHIDGMQSCIEKPTEGKKVPSPSARSHQDDHD